MSGSNSLAALKELANKQLDAEARVAELERQLDDARADLKKISERDLPELLDELGLDEFKTDDGLKIEVKETIRANLSRERSAAGVQWLKSVGQGAVVKYGLSVELGKGQEEMATQIGIEIAQRHPHVSVSSAPTVHAQTLSALVRELLARGEEVPQELLGVVRLRATKVSFKKAKL